MRLLIVPVALTLTAHGASSQGLVPSYDLRQLAEDNLAGLERLPALDEDGYGELAWSTSYGLLALNVLYEATGDARYLEREAGIIGQVLAKRDVDLAGQYGDGPYLDFQRGRVLQAWGTGHYSDGKHTCWLVHTGMLAYPMAEFVRLVRGGGDATAGLRDQAEATVPKVEAALRESDAEWREGPEPGKGHYVFPDGSILPNNQMNAPGAALFVLADLTGQAEYRSKAGKLAAFLKSKLTHVTDGDYYVWAYRQEGPNGAPGAGEDISHAALNAHFAYVAWEHRATFDDTDMARLARTVTKGLSLGAGQLAGVLGAPEPNDAYTAQIGRWGFLARFDLEVERVIGEYIAAHPQAGALGGATGALGYAYLLRARKLRGEGG